VEVETRRTLSCTDGDLYVYRKDEKHVVVASNNNPEESWIKEVPAERTAIKKGEQFYALPDNWEVLVTSERDFGGYSVCDVPTTGQQVLLSNPKRNSINGKYKIKDIGRLKITYADRCDWEMLRDYIDEVENDGSTSPTLVRALKELYDQRYSFEAKLAKEAERIIPIPASDNMPIEVRGRIINPWDSAINLHNCIQLRAPKRDPAVQPELLFDMFVSEISGDRNIVPTQPNMKIEIVSESAE